VLHDEYPPFPGFSAEGLQFLEDLKENNDRAWFKARKDVFDDEVIGPARCLIADFSRQAALDDIPLSGDPQRSIFRIYRDTRFSPDKRPYKTHVGMVLSRSGGRGEEGVVYIHVEPGSSFVGAGFWRPETPLLRLWRQRIAEDPEHWLTLVETTASRGLPVQATDPLKRMPRGFEEVADNAISPWLKGRGFLVSRAVDNAQLRQPGFTTTVLDTARDAMPLLEFGWDLDEE
jgi:uncharacterized protein (TIGR02453 family)